MRKRITKNGSLARTKVFRQAKALQDAIKTLEDIAIAVSGTGTGDLASRCFISDPEGNQLKVLRLGQP